MFYFFFKMDFLSLNVDAIICVLTFLQICDRRSLLFVCKFFHKDLVFTKVNIRLILEHRGAYIISREFDKILRHARVYRKVKVLYDSPAIHNLLKTYFRDLRHNSYNLFKTSKLFPSIKLVENGTLCNDRHYGGEVTVDCRTQFWYINHKYIVIEGAKNVPCTFFRNLKEFVLESLFEISECSFAHMPNDSFCKKFISNFKDLGDVKVFIDAKWARKFVTKIMLLHLFRGNMKFVNFFLRHSVEYISNDVVIDSREKFDNLRQFFFDNCDVTLNGFIRQCKLIDRLGSVLESDLSFLKVCEHICDNKS